MTIKSHVWQPPTDVYDTDDEIIVRVEIAGMNDADFSIDLDQNMLVISGLRPDTTKRKAFQQMEIRFGEFVSQIDLPVPIDTEKVDARYTNGFLYISLPKAQPRHINIIAKTQ